MGSYRTTESYRARRPRLSVSPQEGNSRWHLGTVLTFYVRLGRILRGHAQWQNDNPDFGLGATGYARRFGAAYGDLVIGNYFTEAIIPTLLHQDPRYFRRGTGGGWPRLKYALTRTLITRTDSGRRAFNYSEILGSAAAAGLSTLYYPASDRDIGEVGEKFCIQVAGDSLFNVLIELWPDMRRKFLHQEH